MPFKDGSWHPTRWLGASTVQQCVWNGMDLECRSLQLSIFLVMSVHSNLFITLETFALLISQKGWQSIARWHLMQPCLMQQFICSILMQQELSQNSRLSQFYSWWCARGSPRRRGLAAEFLQIFGHVCFLSFSQSATQRHLGPTNPDFPDLRIF